MSAPDRPGDIIDFVQAQAAANGHFAPVDETYYQAFLTLTQTQLEKLVVVLLLDQEAAVRRAAAGKPEPEAIAGVATLVQHMLTGLSMGLARFDAFANFGFVAPVGSEPSEETQDAIDRKLEQMEPVVANTVRHTLPWLLSRDTAEGRLPL